jgi:hypothetical protein
VDPWEVDWERPFDRWCHDDAPNQADRTAVTEAILRLMSDGPPDDARPIPNDQDRFHLLVLHTAVIIDYFVHGYERLIQIKSIR